MFGSITLDMIIGLSFLYLLMSLVCSTLNELFEAVVKGRAKDLERGIHEFIGSGDVSSFTWKRLFQIVLENLSKAGKRLNSDVKGNQQQGEQNPTPAPANQDSQAANYELASQFVASLYNHGMINCLYRGSYPPTDKRNLPSYIPSENFALAFIATVRNFSQSQPQLPSNVLQALHAFAGSFPPNDKELISAQMKILSNDVVKYQTEIEKWYDTATDRIAGYYKRRSQFFILGIAILAVIMMNVDTFEVIRHLSDDSSLRNCIVAAAQQRVQAKDPGKPDDSLVALRTEKSDLFAVGFPIGWHLESDSSPTDQTAREQWIKDNDVLPVLPPPRFQKWKKQPIQVNWRMFQEDLKTYCKTDIRKFGARLLRASGSHIWGWSVTVVAISLGAPFWFDILNR
ncbi:MAG: hypothetical protein ACRD3W_15900, partial [Terriglobales bacterium]